jgi:hypothetical protein
MLDQRKLDKEFAEVRRSIAFTAPELSAPAAVPVLAEKLRSLRNDPVSPIEVYDQYARAMLGRDNPFYLWAADAARAINVAEKEPGGWPEGLEFVLFKGWVRR